MSEIWNSIAPIYRSELFILFPVVTTVVSAVGFLAFAVPLTAIAVADPPALRKYRIQRKKPRAQDLIKPSLVCFVVNNAVMFAVIVAGWPLLAKTSIHAGPMPAWYVVAAQLVFFIYLDDFLFYWMHRTLHTPWLFKRIHGWHHRILTPWAVTGHYMHPLEYVLTATCALVGPLLVGAHVVTVWLWFAFRQWEAAEGHCGYEFPWTPTHLLPLNDGAIHHDAHHERVRGNYAGFLGYLDGVFGTYVRGYREELASRHAWAARWRA